MQLATGLVKNAQSRDAPVGPMDMEFLGTDRDKPENVFGRFFERKPGWNPHWVAKISGFSVTNCFLGNGIPESLDGKIDRITAGLFIRENDPSAVGHFADNFKRTTFPRGDLETKRQMIRMDKHAVSFLVFAHQDLKHGHGLVAHLYLPDFHDTAGLFH